MCLGRPAMAKKIIFIHGRAQKPDKAPLQALWYEAIEHGLQRDCGDSSSLQAFKDVDKRFVYYGELSNTLLYVVLLNWLVLYFLSSDSACCRLAGSSVGLAHVDKSDNLLTEAMAVWFENYDTSIPFSGQLYAASTKDEALHTSSIKSSSTPRAQLETFHFGEDGMLGQMPNMTRND